MQKMMSQLQSMFGDSFWNVTTIGVSFWAYDQHSIDVRNSTGMLKQ